MNSKMLMGVAALLAANAAFAQTATGSGAPAMGGGTGSTVAAPPTTGGPTDTMSSSDNSGAAMGSSTMSDGMMQSNGKWMNADGSPSTKAQIAAHKKAMKSSKPK